MENISVLTTQNVNINYEIASVGDRYIAAMIDYFIMVAYGILIALIFEMFDWWDYADNMAVVIPLILPVMFYHLWSEVLLEGQSIGKKVRHLKVVNLDSSPVSLSSYLLRWFLGIFELSVSMGGIAILAIILNGHGQRIGDVAAGTTVINLRRRANVEDVLQWQAPANHIVKYPAVAQLTDYDIALIKEILYESERSDLQYPMYKLQEKLQATLRINPEGTRPNVFLHNVIADYNTIYG